MSRWIPWLTELQPELFVELSPELAAEKRIANLDWVRIPAARARARQGAGDPAHAPARRLTAGSCTRSACRGTGAGPASTGDVVNEMSALAGDPNVTIHEGKAFVCNIEKA